MSDLKQLYRQAIVNRVAEIESALHDSELEASARAATLRRVAHSLRGSGGTYGFPEVTDAAADVEDADASMIIDYATTLLDVLHTVIGGGQRAARVHIVDDDPEIQLLLTTVLSDPMRELHSAMNGVEAEQQLAGGDFALIILDLLMPDIDGRDVLQRIRGDARFENTAVIVLSARANDETRRACEQLGATAFFEKPFDPEAVAAAVSAQLLRLAGSPPRPTS
jgi:CheY-like chemotaxis protein